MASDAISPSTTCMTLFFLLIIFHSSMATNMFGFPPFTSSSSSRSYGGGEKKNSMEFTTRKLHGIGNSKTLSTRQSVAMPTNNGHNNVNPPSARRKARFQARRSPLPWQDKIFNASEHEVPSGPNPISNR